MVIFQNRKKKDWFSQEIELVFVYGKFAKVHPGSLPHLRWSSLQQLVIPESCKGFHLMGLQAIVLKLTSCQTPPDARFYKKKLFTQFLNITCNQHVSINFQSTFTSSKLP